MKSFLKSLKDSQKPIQAKLQSLTSINAQPLTSTNAQPLTSTSVQPFSCENIPGIPQNGNEYSKLLGHSLYFFEAQRSGVLPANNRVPWRHNSALTDGHDVGLDLTGGYYDAGDYLKFTLPLSWSLSIVSWGALEWFDGYQLSGQTGYLYDMVKWGTDWLLKAHPKPNVLYVEVGIDTVDHDYWGPDTGMPYPRPSLCIDASRHGTDVAAEAAAALASASLLFRTKFNQPDYANLLLQHAVDLFNFAETKPHQVYTVAVPQAKEAYESSRYDDKLVFAALWLFQATNQIGYLDRAIHYFNEFSQDEWTSAINWDDHSGSNYILLAMLTEKVGRDCSPWKEEAEKYLDGMVNQKHKECHHTHGGLLWLKGDSDSASLNVALNISFALLVYARHATTSHKTRSYTNFALSQIDYLLGKNPLNKVYVVGAHHSSPKNPHHAGASGGTDIGNISHPPVSKYVLYGAVVGGPDKKDRYNDDREDYARSEVTLDYNAPFQSLMAYQVMHANYPPPYLAY
ncbi:9352_t:CDS:2 [Gigaspora margarita]|uniref:Endoglucanase n=1 Tax=Gigaspora margarita TaxID=4874 RepID=A0ABN7UKT0_GIGMA|nr:9352_t:CDS:2 [Gigaspora margarita]